MRVTRTSLWRSVAVTFALTAMLFRGVLPVGWMPDPARGSGTLITICTLSGPVHIYVGNDGQPLKPKPSHNDGGRVETCPFAGALHIATLAAPAAVPEAIIFAASVQLPARHDVAIDHSRFSLHPPRAPPSLA